MPTRTPAVAAAQRAHDLAALMFPDLCDPDAPAQFDGEAESEAHTLARLIHDVEGVARGCQCDGMGDEVMEPDEDEYEDDEEEEEEDAEFSEDEDESPALDSYVIRTGKIFEVGDFPDKDFSLTGEEMASAVAMFSPVDVDIEHMPSPLSGKLGKLQAVRMHEDGRTLIGDWHVPAWLDPVLADAERKVSCTWDRARKLIAGLALVRTPRVSDAALFAAFSEAHPEDATFATPRKMADDLTESMQHIHDQIAMSHPWTCGGASSMFADKPKQAKAIKAMHDSTTDHGATCPGKTSVRMSGGEAPPETEESDMDLVKFREAVGKLPDKATPEEIKAALALAPAEVLAAFSVTRPAPVPVPESIEMADLRRRFEASEARSEADRKARIETDAVAFASDQFDAGKILPKAADNLIALFKQAASDDHDHETTVNFTADAKPAVGKRLDALRAFFADVTPHPMFVPTTGNGDLKALFNKRGVAPTETSAADAEAELTKNLSYTETGRAILAKRKGA